jgi:hypothetical protein
MTYQRTIYAAFLSLLVATLSEVFAGDWPMWGGDAGRRGIARTRLPETLHLH